MLNNWITSVVTFPVFSDSITINENWISNLQSFPIIVSIDNNITPTILDVYAINFNLRSHINIDYNVSILKQFNNNITKLHNNHFSICQFYDESLQIQKTININYER